MDINDKLQHFREVSLNHATMKKTSLLKDYTDGVDIQLENHKEAADKRYETQKKTGMDKLKNEAASDYSYKSQLVKKKLSDRKNELTDSVFDEVNTLLEDFYKSEDYYKFLVDRINNAKKYADSSELVVYIDKEDEDKAEKLKKDTDVNIIVSDESFGRGIRGEIKEKNIFINDSIADKLNMAKDNFSLIP